MEVDIGSKKPSEQPQFGETEIGFNHGIEPTDFSKWGQDQSEFLLPENKFHLEDLKAHWNSFPASTNLL